MWPLSKLAIACFYLRYPVGWTSMWNVPVSIWNKSVHIIVWLKSFDFIMDNRVTWGKDMDDAVLFNGCIINQEIIFNANMNELRPLAGDGECISLNAPTARCLLLLLQNCGKVISRDEFLAAVWETRGWSFRKIRSIKISLCCENRW